MASKTRTIEIFRPGTLTSAEGRTLTFSAEDVAAIASAYDPAAAPAPIVIGHPTMDAPAYGWAAALRWDADRQRLLADVDQVDASFAEDVQAGKYKRVSASLFDPANPANPRPGSWYLRHIGFLGAAAPAVSGLAPVCFAALADATLEFGEAGFRDVASVFRSLRDFMISKFGLESANQALPDWQIGWIDQQGQPDADDPQPVGPSYAAPPAISPQEQTMTDKTKAATTADLDARAADLDRRERELLHRDHVSFAEGLVAQGRLIPASKERVVALLDAVAPASANLGTVSFAAPDGKTATASAADLVRQVLADQPKVVTFGSVVPPEERGVAVDFAAPEGMAVDQASAELHARAVAYQRDHVDVDYMAAVRAVRGR